MPETRRYDTGPLGRLALNPWQRVEVVVRSQTEATLILDPNRISWNGYAPEWVSTRMAGTRFDIRLRPVPVPQPPGRPRPAYPFRLYDILPGGTPLAEFGFGARPRLALTDHPDRPSRLLRCDARGAVVGVLPIVRKDTGAQPPVGEAADLISLRTAFLGGKIGRTAFFQISGLLSDGTLEVVADGNAVQLDPTGEPSTTTLMAPLPRKVRLVEKSGLPPGTRARVFDLEGGPSRMSLVLPDASHAAARLVLYDAAGRADAFLPLEPDLAAAGPLVGPLWNLAKIAYNDDRTLTPPRSAGGYSVRFSSDGRVTGRIGRNRIQGGYRVVRHQIRIGPLASTRAASLPGGVDGPFLRDLQDARSFKIQGDELWLMLPVDVGTIVLKRNP